MKLITRDTDYAIRALKKIGEESNAVYPVAELAEKLKIPRPFLRKILQKLASEGIMNSYKGKGGGFSLARDVDDIYVTQVMEAFQGEFELSECIFKKGICPSADSCVMRKKIMSIQDLVQNELEKITIGQLIKEET
ncbi:MAG: RrF2 family transcriptional regulator [Actinomycetota bacterium]